VTDDKVIARIVHEANRAYNYGLNDLAPDPPFDILPGWQQQFVIDRVKLIRKLLQHLSGEGALEVMASVIHQDWVTLLLSRGWELGYAKNPAGDPPTHPCLKGWELLPSEQQLKDTMAIAIVREFCPAPDRAWREMVQLGEEIQGHDHDH
jgi:hypothetical protein